MSILKSTGSGVNAPLTEAFLFERGYKKEILVSGFNRVDAVWKVPEGKSIIGNYQLKSNGSFFYIQIWIEQPPTIIRTIQALLYLEKYWSAGCSKEFNKYAELVESCQY